MSQVLLLLALAGAVPVAETNLLLDALNDQDEDIRFLAASLLDEPTVMDTETVPALERTVRDEDESWRVRAAAATSLGRHLAAGRREASPVLADAARDGDVDWRVRAAAVEAIWTADGGRALRRAARASGGSFAIEAGRSTVTFGRHSNVAVADLAHALRDDDPRVRRLASVATLVAGRTARSLEPDLVEALDDADCFVRCHAARALCKSCKKRGSCAHHEERESHARLSRLASCDPEVCSAI